MASSRPNNFSNQGFLPNGASATSASAPNNLLPHNGRVVQSGGVRVLCVADVRGNLRSLNELAKQARADHIIHTGDFGFYDEASLDRIADKTLKHVSQYSPLLSEDMKKAIAEHVPQQQPLKRRFRPDQVPLSELPAFLNKTYTLNVPVYTVCGACEDVRVLEKFRSGEYKVDKLHVIDEANSRLLDVGGVKLRLLGLGGAVVMHKLFDNGEGRTTIAGGQGTMWTTLLQMGELVDTANRVYDPTETRVFVTHASPAREGLLNQLSVTLKADFSISAGLHFRYGSSYNEFSVNPTLDHYRGKLAASKASFHDVWETVKHEVMPAVTQNDAQKTLLDNALDIVQKMPSVANGGNPFGGPVNGPNAGGQVDEGAFKNMWNFNLADAAFGWLVLEVDNGRIGTEMRAQGFNFAHRGGKSGMPPHMQQQAVAPSTSTASPGGSSMMATNSASKPVPPRPGAAPVGANQSYQQQQNQHAQPTNQQSNQPRQAPPQQQRNANAPQQPQSQSKPGPGPTRNNQSPAPAPAQTKPATPQPTATNVNLPAPAGKDKPSTPAQGENARNGNGTASKDSRATTSPAAKPSPVDNKPPTGLWVNGVKDEEAFRQLLPEDDRAKIVRTEKSNKGTSLIVHFSSTEEVQGVMDRLPPSYKGKSEPGTPNIRFYQTRHGGGFDGAGGRWQGSNRGGGSAGGQSGYRSGGASDSDGAGRGGRGGSRGGTRGRGERGRGGRGGRGSYNNGSGRPGQSSEGGASSPAPTTAPSSTPAPAATSS
ncbi:MAG: hypothetical protein M1817_000462 [Caeruleum heppii]|nr:MAG: hypothetical protein M1817_000462 [Caeruleum heppii]